MKNKKTLIFLTIFLVLCFVSPVLATTGGLLDGKLMYIGDSVGDIVHSTYNATDSSLTTYYNISTVTGNKYIWHQLPSPTVINAYISKDDNIYIYIRLYDSSKNLLYSTRSTHSNSLTSITPVSNVSYVSEFINTDSGAGNIYNFDVFCPGPPDAPLNLSISGSGGNGILTWSSVTNATSYNIYDGSIQIANSSVPSYSFSNLSVGSHILYVTAVNSNGESIKSNGVTYNVVPNMPVLNLSNITASSANVNWGLVSGATSYDISINGSFLVNTTNTSYTMTNLTQNQNYSISIVAKSSVGNSNPGTASFTTFPLPSPPQGLQASNITSSSVDLTWSGTSGATSYILDQNGNILATTSNNFYHCTGLIPQTAYTYQVAVVTEVGESHFSDPINISTLGLPPTAPTGLSAGNLTGKAFTIYWNSQTDATAYDVYLNGTYQGTVNQPLISNPSYYFSGLNIGTTYSVSVIAGNTWGQSSASNALNVLTKTIPRTPTGLTLNNTTNTTIDISWTANDPMDAVTGYKLFVNGNPYGSIITGTTQSMTGFTKATTYTIAIKAVNDQGDSALSNSVTATTTDEPTTVPGPVEGITASNIKTDGLTLSWSNIPKCDAYDVLNTNTDSLQTTSGSPLILTGLQPSTSYTFKIRAHNNLGYGDYSEPIVITTLGIPPTVPTGLSAGKITSTSLTLYWLKQSDATSYNVYMDGTLVKNVWQPFLYNPSLDIGGLDGGSTHSMTVTAVNPWGESTTSQPFTVTAAVPNPVLKATVDNSNIKLTWTGLGNDFDIMVNDLQISQASSGSYTLTEKPGTYKIQVIQNYDGQQYPSNILPVTISALQNVGATQMIRDIIKNVGIAMAPVGGLLAITLALKGGPMLLAAAKALLLKM